ncbi:MAG: RDD family protein [Steroidobacteraceae bacterium]
MSESTSIAAPAAGLLRRLGAMVYDALLVIAILMVATVLFLPFTGGEAVSLEVAGPVLFYFYRVWLVVLIVGFFGLFWTRRGQTLGMAAWRLRLVRDDGRKFTWADALKRLAAACLSWLPVGLGFLWMLVDDNRLAWHDRLTHTRVVLEPKQK